MKLKKCLILLSGFLLAVMLCACGASAPKPEAISLESISLDKEDLTIAPGEEYEFKLGLTPTDISIENISLGWESSDTSVATVSDGKLIGISEGTVVITVKSSGGITASCFVTVKEPSAYDKLDGSDKSLYNTVIDCSASFANPSSVSVKSVHLVDKENFPGQKRC